ncbi:OmpA family protein [Psychroflexus planctonicus]|uniref:OmpA-like domain-containing protein n=1 Tax=Psychroflexus planctonicus TaxID=1526575 RepID=A0ABQ1SEM8_9FLAO|nr:OmpA family protein [Psychroflexus planctonicus]GGE27652.1 hypothetical protein GCM10010832_05450 [Psychroflexus planctonicus]
MKLEKIIWLSFCLLLFASNYGQTSEGEIVISEEKIQQLANKLYELKLKRNPIENTITKINDEELIIRRLNNIIKTDTLDVKTLTYLIENILTSTEKEEVSSITIDSLNTSQSDVKTKTTRSINNEKTSETNQILERLSFIENQLKELKFQNSEPVIVEQSSDNTTNEEVVVKKWKDRNTSKILALQILQQNALSKTNSKLDSLLQLNGASRKDSLTKRQTEVTKTNAPQNNKEIESLKNQIYLLHAKLDRVLDDKIEKDAVEKVETASTLSDTVYADKTKEIDSAQEAYEARKRKYGSYFEQIFFENNSTKVKEEYQNLISNLVQQLNNETKIDVLIAGYASKTGNEDYNQQISMQRALALKMKLMQEGIAPERILTDYRGIDYDAQNLAEARRLDIKYVVRK